MFIMGDVLAVVALVLGVGVTLWAAIVAFGVLFGERAREAAALAESRWAPTLGTGALLAATAGGIGLALASQPNGALQLVGWVVLIGLLSLAVLGSAGLALLASDRIEKLSPAFSRFAALGRGAALLVTAGFLPALGWFGFFPVLLLLSLGSGARVVLRRKRAAAVQAVQPVAVTAAPASERTGNDSPFAL